MQRAAHLLMGLVLGLAGGIFLAGFLAEPDRDVDTWAGGSSRPAEPERPGERPPMSSARRQADEPAPITGDQVASLGEVLGDVSLPEMRTGEGVVTGRVTDERGAALAGVVVRAISRGDGRPSKDRWRPGDGAPPRRDLMERIRRYVVKQRESEATRRDAVTDEDGRYLLEGLDDGRYSLRAYLAGYELKARGGAAFPVRAGDELDFSARPVVSAPARVVFADGGMPDKAEIRWEAGRRIHSQNWSPEVSDLRISPGTFALTATHGEDHEYESAPKTVTFEVGAEPAELVFELKAPTGVRGKILFEESPGFDHLQVWALKTGGDAVPDETKVRSQGTQTHCNRWNGFRFLIKDLAPGRYHLAVGSHDGPFIATSTVEVGHRLVDHDLRVGPPDPADFVVVWVHGPDGKPIDDARVTATGGRGRFRRRGSQAVRRRDGSYWVPRPRGDGGEDPDVYVVRAKSKAWGEKSVERPARPGAEVRVTFEEAATVEVTLEGHAGSGHEGALRLQLNRKTRSYDPNRLSIGPGDRKVGSDAKVTFSPVQPGEHELVLLVESRRSSYIPVERRSVPVRAGVNRVVITVPSLHGVTIELDPGTGAEHISLRPVERIPGFWGLSQKVGKHGRVTFERVPAGEYVVAAGSEMMKVTVPGPKLVHFEAQVQNALLVTVTADAGALAEAGLQTGDLVIGADGTEFTDLGQMQLLLAGHISRGPDADVTLTVRRGGRDLEIVMKAARMGKQGDELGGYMTPAQR